MKSETKNKLIWILIIPILVIVFSSCIVVLAGAWSDRFATKEYTANRYLTKADAEKLFQLKTDGKAQEATLSGVKDQVGYIRKDMKTVVKIVSKLDRKVDTFLILNQQIVEHFVKKPPPPKTSPIKMVNKGE